jgi:hypothetical protein
MAASVCKTQVIIHKYENRKGTKSKKEEDERGSCMHGVCVLSQLPPKHQRRSQERKKGKEKHNEK